MKKFIAVILTLLSTGVMNGASCEFTEKFIGDESAAKCTMTSDAAKKLTVHCKDCSVDSSCEQTESDKNTASGVCRLQEEMDDVITMYDFPASADECEQLGGTFKASTQESEEQ